MIDPLRSDSSGWNLLARARAMHSSATAVVYSGAWNREVFLRSIAEKAQYLDKLAPPEELRRLVREGLLRGTPVQRAIAELAQRTKHVLDLTGTERVVVESELLGLEKGKYSDGRNVAASTVDGHEQNILVKAREAGLFVPTWDGLRRAWQRELSGIDLKKP